MLRSFFIPRVLLFAAQIVSDVTFCYDTLEMAAHGVTHIFIQLVFMPLMF